MLTDDQLRQVLLDKGKALVEAEVGPEVAARCTPNEAVLATLAQYGRAVEAAVLARPVGMVLHCPACGLQHIDAEEHDHPQGWDNPPHRSHLCGGCGHVWRPADVPTEGIPAVYSKGKNDSPIAAPRDGVPPALDVRRILLDVVPGDGDGLEVFAKSVADVESRMTALCERIPDEDGGIAPAHSAVLDYGALVAAAWSLHRYAQGTGACIAFKHGAEWQAAQRAVKAEILERLHEYTRAVVDEATSVNHASAKAYAALARSNLLDALGIAP